MAGERGKTEIGISRSNSDSSMIARDSSDMMADNETKNPWHQEGAPIEQLVALKCGGINPLTKHGGGREGIATHVQYYCRMLLWSLWSSQRSRLIATTLLCRVPLRS